MIQMDQKVSKAHGVGWLNPVKAFALLAVMLNHFVEEFGESPWFTHPLNAWPDFTSRVANIWPTDHVFPISLLKFLGWLGDSAPGVFIVVSGFALTWSTLHRSGLKVGLADFYRRRFARIFPLYIAAHFVILAGSLLVGGNEATLASLKTLLSLLGLRFTSSLFFYINPSWWFVWLILQLYLIFPCLYILLHRCSTVKFLLLTFGFTVCCNLCGIIFLSQSPNLYPYMMGMFFGTRLTEFCVGMIIALAVKKANDRSIQLPAAKHIFCYSAASYIVGFGLSLTWPGTLVSTPLISMGMTGIFYCAWKGFFRKISLLSYILAWIGTEAYAIYLIHQTPLKWTAAFFQGTPHVIAAVLVLAVSFPAGYLLRRVVDGIQGYSAQMQSS
jgi:peptidoglycan/LPS O-acetylase OafA/YrhL